MRLITPRPEGPLVVGLALAIVLLLVGAGSQLSAPAAGKGDPVVVERPTEVVPLEVSPRPPGLDDATEGEGIPVAPSPSAEPSAAEAPFQQVTSTRASVVATVSDVDEARAREVLAGMEGVVHVTGITTGTIPLGGVPARVAAIDPEPFRPFTPDATANHQPLWERIEAGDVAVTHEFGTGHQVTLGTRLGAGNGDVPYRIGAFATNGTPPVADAIVAQSSAAPLALERAPDASRRLLVALDALASPEATVEALGEEGITAEEIPDPRVPRSDLIVPQGTITPENVWDYLAMCESSGDWHINTGNGYYGGIQFLPESWWAVGGTGLPHEHSREEQIYRGTLLWQIQGWEAWPQCARKLGLIVDQPSRAPQ